MQRQGQNIVLLEEIEDVVERVERDLVGERIRQDSHPIVTGVVTIVPYGATLMSSSSSPRFSSTNEVNRQILNVFLVEQVNNLGTNVSPQIVALQEVHEPKNE